MLTFDMGSEGSQAETGDASGRGRHGALLKLAILVGVSAPVLVFLFASPRDRSGLVAGPTLPPGKVGPQLVNTLVHAGFLLAPDGSLWCWRTTDSPNPSLVEDSLELPQRVGTDTDWCRVFAVRSDGTLWICGEDTYSVVRAYAGTPAKALFQIGKEADWKEVYAGRGFYLARKRDGSWWVSGQCKRPLRGARWRWSPPVLASPRRLALRFEPWALAPEVGDAMLLTRYGSLWTLSVLPDSSGFDLEMARLKTLVNQTLAHLPGSPEPFDEEAFRIDLRVRKLWELPPEVRN
jgi:hypothetical protein